MEQKQYLEAAAALMKDPSKRSAFAEMMVEWVQPNHIVPDFVSMLLDSRALKLGDSLVKKLRKGIQVHTLVPGTIPLASEITVTDRMNFNLDQAVVKVRASQWDLDNGDIGTVADIKREMGLKLKDYYQNKVFTALSTIWSAANTPNNYVSVGGPVTATVLRAAIDYINQTAGGVKTVVGIKSVMTPITDFAGFWVDPNTGLAMSSDPAMEEIRRTGQLGQFYGANLTYLTQLWDNPEDYNTLLPTDKILVIGQSVGEFITYGPERSSEYTDPRPVPPDWFAQIYAQFGIMVWNAGGIYVLDNVTS